MLAKVQVYDRRSVSEADARAWAQALHDVPLSVGIDAVTAHFRSSDAWLQPSHVKAFHRWQAAQNAPRGLPSVPGGWRAPLTPDELADKVAACRAAIRNPQNV